ncbi:MAG: metalloregulator ArsR/SmtB family transcription factor [Pseudomonadota bacterium]
MPNYQVNLDDAFRALADPTRRAVLQRLSQGSASVKELAEPFDMALPSFMQHLRVLEDSGLVSSEKKGRTRTCDIQPAALLPVEDWIAEQRAIWERRFDRLDEYLKELNASGEAP